MNVLDDFKTFFNSGHYQNMIELEKVLNTLRDQIREYQSQLGKKRMEWEEGAVGIFESVRVFDKNIIGFKEYLSHLGLLPVVTTINWKSFSMNEQESLMPFAVPKPALIRFTSSKENKTYSVLIEKFNQHMREMSINYKVQTWLSKKEQYDLLNKKWSSIHNQLIQTMVPGNRIELGFGTLSCRPTDPEVSAINVFRNIGMTPLLNFGKINETQLAVYTARGFINRTQINEFRKVIDIKLRYVLMSKMTDTKRYEGYQQYLRFLSYIGQVD